MSRTVIAFIVLAALIVIGAMAWRWIRPPGSTRRIGPTLTAWSISMA